MLLNSVNTHFGAMVALQSLERSGGQLAATQKRISTGFRVADARDDGAAFAVAQAVRADIVGLASANEQLGGVKGILETTLAALHRVSDMMADMRGLLVKIVDRTVSDAQRVQYLAAHGELLSQAATVMRDSAYNNRSLIATGGTAMAKLIGDPPDGLLAQSLGAVRNERGDVFMIEAVDADELLAYDAYIGGPGVPWALRESGPASFGNAMAALGTALNRFGNAARFIDGQMSANRSKIDALESGMGSLMNADLARESARLQSLQIRQQLGTQALGIANQAPQMLLSLFR